MKSESSSNQASASEALVETEECKLQLPAYLEKADQYASENRWAEAAACYRQAADLEPNDNSILGKLGFCYSRNRQHDLAIEVFSELSKREPHIARWPYMIGYQYYDKKEWQKAIQFFDKALSLKSDYIKVLYRNGYARLQIGDLGGAEELLIRCIDCWRQLDDDRKLAERNRYSDACFQLGKLYLAKGLTLKAEKWLKEAVNQDNNDEHKHYNLGKAFLKNGKIPEALEEFRLADTLHPHLDYFQDKLASTYLLVGNSEEAERIYQAIPPPRRKPYIWCNYGIVLLQRGKPDDAIRALKNAARLDYQNHRIHFYLGSAYLEARNVSLSVKELKLAAQLKLERFGSEYKEATEKLQLIRDQFGEEVNVALVQHDIDDGDRSYVGRIESYNVKRGFGFLKSGSGERIFFHVSDVANPDDIVPGRQAEFERVESDKGPKAIKMSIG